MPPPSTRTAGRPRGVQVDTDLVRKYRERAGLSREDLAEVVGATTRTLQKAENEGLIGMPLLKRMCDVLRLPVVAVLRQDGDAIRASLGRFGFAPGLPPLLVGRGSELTALRAKLVQPGQRVVLVLEGPIGVGKTSLAQALAQGTASHFVDGVVWVRGDFTDARHLQLDLARALGFDGELPSFGTTASGRDWTQAFTHHFWRRRRLLVLDDVSVRGRLSQFVATEEPVTMLVTTRFQHVAEDEVVTERARIEPLADAPILEILTSGVDRAQIDKDAASLERLLQVIGGMPGVAQVVRTALRHERLTTPKSWLARFASARSGPPDAQQTPSAAAYYASLEHQISASAWQFFVALGAFESEPVPLSWAAAASGTTQSVAELAASELLDARIVDLYRAADEVDREPWLRLATHPAAAARSMLDERIQAGTSPGASPATGFEVAQRRIVDHVLAELARCRTESPAALVRYFRRHQALFVRLRRDLTEGFGPPPRLAQVDSPDAVELVAVDAARARALLDQISAIAPLIFDQLVADGEEWLGLGLVAARSFDRAGVPVAPPDLERQGRQYLFVAWWRGLLSMKPTPSLDTAALDALRRSGNPLALLAAQPFIQVVRQANASPEEAARHLAEMLADIRAPAPRGGPRSCALTAASRIVHMATPGSAGMRDAASLSQLALDELRESSEPNAHLEALLEVNRESWLRRAGDDNHEALARAVAVLRQLQPEPWFKAALLAHAAVLGANMGFASREAAIACARRELTECTRDCEPDAAPRLLFFVATCGFYGFIAHATAGQSPLVRDGLAGHGVSTPVGIRSVAEAMGNDAVLMLSLEATAALLDLEYVELALALADNVTDGRLVSAGICSLRDALAISQNRSRVEDAK